MRFGRDFWIGLVVGVVLGFVICEFVAYLAHDTGPHKIEATGAPEL
jgi:hypothetical protein